MKIFFANQNHSRGGFRAVLRQCAASVLALGLLAALVFSSCAASPAASATSAAFAGLGLPADKVPFMQNVRRGTLPNGLRYYILKNAKPENRASLTLAVHAGAVLEKDDEQGLAHFVEHLAFNGTAHFPNKSMWDYFRTLGMRDGADANAHTSYDETVYGIEVPVETDAAGVKRIPQKALSVLDDWTYTVLFTDAGVDAERPIVLEEKRMRSAAMSRMWEQLLPTLLKGSRYASRMVIGKEEIIQNAPTQTLENFYKTWYRPDNMALVIVGDFDDAALEASLQSSFTAPAAETAFTHPTDDLPPPQKGLLKTAALADSELPYTLASLYYKQQPKPLTGDLASYREGLIDHLISSIIGQRFDEAAQKSDAPFMGAGAYTMRWGASSSFYILSAQAKTNNAETSLNALLLEKERIVRYGFTEDEAARAKTALLSALEQKAAEKDNQESSSYVGDFTDNFLTGLNIADIEWELDAAQRLLPGISPADMANRAKKYFADDDLTVAVLAPTQDGLVSEKKIASLVKSAKRAKIEKPKADAVDAELVREKPVAGAITSETVDADTQAIIWELGNGAKVVLKQTKNKSSEIVLFAEARGGFTSAEKDSIISARFAPDMLNASGAGPYTLQEIVKKLAGKQADLSCWMTTNTRGFSGVSTVKDAQTLFELIYLSFTQQKLDPEAVNALLSQYETYLANRDLDPQSVLSKEVNKTILSGNPYFTPLEVSDLAQADMGKALSFIKKGLNPADYTFVFTGNIGSGDGLAAIRSLTETYLASIPRLPDSWNAWDDPLLSLPKPATREIYKGKEEKSVAYLNWAVAETYSEEKAAAAAVLKEYLNIRLNDQIREKMNAVYSIGAGLSLNPSAPRWLMMEVSFPCDPKRVAELIAASIAEIKKVADGNIDAKVFAQSQEILKKSWETSIQDNSYIAESYANSIVFYNSPLSRLDKRPGRYAAVTQKDVQAMTAQLLKNAPIQMVLYPEGK